MVDNRIIYEASQKLELKWIKENSISHEFADGKGIIVLKEGVTEIGESAFSKCVELISIVIPDSIVEIGMSAFCECRELASVNLPDSVKRIESGGFYGCSELKNITLPDSVRVIEEFAFGECYKLPDDVRTKIQKKNRAATKFLFLFPTLRTENWSDDENADTSN